MEEDQARGSDAAGCFAASRGPIPMASRQSGSRVDVHFSSGWRTSRGGRRTRALRAPASPENLLPRNLQIAFRLASRRRRTRSFLLLFFFTSPGPAVSSTSRTTRKHRDGLWQGRMDVGWAPQQTSESHRSGGVGAGAVQEAEVPQKKKRKQVRRDEEGERGPGGATCHDKRSEHGTRSSLQRRGLKRRASGTRADC